MTITTKKDEANQTNVNDKKDDKNQAKKNK